MPIILGLLGTVVTILVLLNRLAEAGIDLGGLNPYLWHRRRKWRKQYEGNPIFRIENPMDATAILMVATAKADGDITKEDKALLLNLFEKEFNLSKKDSAGLLISSSHLLGSGEELRGNINRFLSSSKASFTDIQRKSAMSLISQVAGAAGSMHANVKELLQQVAKELEGNKPNDRAW